MVCERIHQCKGAGQQECPHLGCQWIQRIPGEEGAGPQGGRCVLQMDTLGEMAHYSRLLEEENFFSISEQNFREKSN